MLRRVRLLPAVFPAAPGSVPRFDEQQVGVDPPEELGVPDELQERVLGRRDREVVAQAGRPAHPVAIGAHPRGEHLILAGGAQRRVVEAGRLERGHPEAVAAPLGEPHRHQPLLAVGEHVHEVRGQIDLLHPREPGLDVGDRLPGHDRDVGVTVEKIRRPRDVVLRAEPAVSVAGEDVVGLDHPERPVQGAGQSDVPLVLDDPDPERKLHRLQLGAQPVDRVVPGRIVHEDHLDPPRGVRSRRRPLPGDGLHQPGDRLGGSVEGRPP